MREGVMRSRLGAFAAVWLAAGVCVAPVAVAAGEECKRVTPTIRGTKGDDVLRGYHGADEVEGNEGDDRLHGGPDTDEVDGDSGTDECTGGETTSNCEA